MKFLLKAGLDRIAVVAWLMMMMSIRKSTIDKLRRGIENVIAMEGSFTSKKE